MFWIICLVVFVALLAGIGYAMSRSQRGGGLGNSNHDALNDAAARANGRHTQGGGGFGSGFGG